MSPPILGLLVIAAVSFAVATMLTPIVARLAVLQGWLDHPDGQRKVHSVPIPAVGGVAVFVGFAITLLAFVTVGQDTVGGALSEAAPYVPMLLAGALVSVIGLLDDIRGVPPLGKRFWGKASQCCRKLFPA